MAKLLEIESNKKEKKRKDKQLSPTIHSPKNEMSSSRLPAPLVLVGTDSSYNSSRCTAQSPKPIHEGSQSASVETKTKTKTKTKQTSKKGETKI
jgi:hypothetical protein